MKVQKDAEILKRNLKKIAGRDYHLYSRIRGSYRFSFFKLDIPFVQKEPHSSMTKLRLFVSHKDTPFPHFFRATPERILGMEDYLLRCLVKEVEKFSGRERGTGNSGLISIFKPGQEVLKRDAVKVRDDGIEVIMEIGLPALGRRVKGDVADDMFFKEIPGIMESVFLGKNINLREMEKYIRVIEDQELVRKTLEEKRLVAFIPDGAVLPRKGDKDDSPPLSLKDSFLKDVLICPDGRKIVPFKSPDSLRVEINFPNAGRISGLGLKEGVTVVTGKRASGKSTLINAISRGVWSHIPGDGREYLITRSDGVFIKMEGRRSIRGVELSCFFMNQPFFELNSDEVEGAFSQAGSLMEFIEAGSRLFFFDEDSSHPEFLSGKKSPDRRIENFIPLIERVREMYEKHSISFIIATENYEEFKDVADMVILMKEYIPHDLSLKRDEQRKKTIFSLSKPLGEFRLPSPRAIMPETFSFLKKDKFQRLKVISDKEIILKGEKIDLCALEGIVEESQLHFIPFMMEKIASSIPEGGVNLKKIIDDLFDIIEKNGFYAVCGNRIHGRLSIPRKFELFAIISRLKTLSVKRRRIGLKSSEGS